MPVETVLNLSAFDLDQILERRPTFLEPEYPFEWTGVFKLNQGKYEISLEEGPDPTMSLVVMTDQEANEDALKESAEKCVRLYATESLLLNPGESIPVNQHITLELEAKGEKSFPLEIKETQSIGLFTQHTAEEFNIKVKNIDLKDESSGHSASKSSIIASTKERVWAAAHEHDDEVGSMAIEREGNVDPKKINDWIGRLLSLIHISEPTRRP